MALITLGFAAMLFAMVRDAPPGQAIDGANETFREMLAGVREAGANRQLLHVCAIQFTRNFGQTAAFAAGFAHARGRFIVTSDGDLQNDPADIPWLLQHAQSHDIVCGWRKERRDNFLTRYIPSVVANWLISAVTGIRLHDTGCSLKIFRSEVVKPLNLTPGMHRYLPALASRFSGRMTEVVVNHRPRHFGRSKYGLSRTFSVLRDLVRLRRFMRMATDPFAAPAVRLYEIRQIRETTPPRR